MCVRKGLGLLRDAIQWPEMQELCGASSPEQPGALPLLGIGHVRYPTAGAEFRLIEATQPFEATAEVTAEVPTAADPLRVSIALSHNGNVINCGELPGAGSGAGSCTSDSEVLLGAFRRLFEAAAAKRLRQLRGGGGGGGGGGRLGREAAPDEGSAEGLTALAPARQPLPSAESEDVRLALEESALEAGEALMRLGRGGIACAVLIGGVGVLGMRDRFGVRPLCIGLSDDRSSAALSSESVAFTAQGLTLEGDVLPGESVLLCARGGRAAVRRLGGSSLAQLRPCLFEYVYMARPDAVLDGVEVYAARCGMGSALGRRMAQRGYGDKVDVVVPVPETSRPAALRCAAALGVPYEEGLTKTRHIARTFIMRGERERISRSRSAAVRKKLSPVATAIAGRRVLLVDDSIVRGATARAIVEMVREAGATEVHLASAAPPVLYPNYYGIDLPTHEELVAHRAETAEEDVARAVGADSVVFQTLEDLEAAVRRVAPPGCAPAAFEDSIFTGNYLAGLPDRESISLVDANGAGAVGASVDVV